jgi:glycosyltransferase involved in cell wall biosynthesis
MKPKISVIIPVYKVEPYLHRCVESIQSQTLNNIEIILVNDGSPDKCPDICDEYARIDRRIKVIHKDNRGVSSARNAGLDIAIGEYITFVDSDDWIEPMMLEYLLGLADGARTKFAACELYREDDKGNILKATKISKQYMLDVESALSFKKYVESFSVAKLYPAWLFRSGQNYAKGIRFDESLHHSEDLLFVSECIIEAGGLFYDTKPCYHYIQRSGSSRNVPFNGKQFTALDARMKLIALKKQISASLVREAKCDYVTRAVTLLANIYREKTADSNKYYVKKLKWGIRKYFGEYILSRDISFYAKLRTMLLLLNPRLVVGASSEIKSIFKLDI